MKTRNHKNFRSSGIVGDNSEESGAFLFCWRIPDFCDGRRLFPTYENSILCRWGRSGTIGDGLRSLPIPYCLTPVPLSLINMASQIQYRENLGQTSDNYPIYRQNLGRSAKSKILDRLGFFRHMKTSRKHLKLLGLLSTSSCVNLVTIVLTVFKLHREGFRSLPPQQRRFKKARSE